MERDTADAMTLDAKTIDEIAMKHGYRRAWGDLEPTPTDAISAAIREALEKAEAEFRKRCEKWSMKVTWREVLDAMRSYSGGYDSAPLARHIAEKLKSVRLFAIFHCATCGAEMEKGKPCEDCTEERRKILEEDCAPDEKHCTCVPVLRQRIREMENALPGAPVGPGRLL